MFELALIPKIMLPVTITFILWLISGLRKAIQDQRTELQVYIEKQVASEVEAQVLDKARIEVHRDEETQGLIFSIKNISTHDLRVKSFRFFDENYVLVSEIRNRDYPDMSPGRTLTFSIVIENESLTDHLRTVITVESDRGTNEFLVPVPPIQIPEQG